MHRFRRLDVWHRARAAAIQVYRLTRSFPDDERYGLTSQLRRAAISVGANLVEGSKRMSDREFARFVNVSESSAGEVWFLLDLLPDLKIGHHADAPHLADEYLVIEKMLHALRKQLVTPEPVS